MINPGSGSPALSRQPCLPPHRQTLRAASHFIKIVNSKLLIEDVTAAVRIVASDHSVITPTSEVATALRLRHPTSPLDFCPPPTEPISQTSSVSEEEVLVTMKSFRPRSAGGVDGLRP